MRNLPHILAEVFTKPWLIEARKGAVIARVVARAAAGPRASIEEIEDSTADARAEMNARIAAADRMNAARAGIAVIEVLGVLVHRGAMDNSSGMTSTELVMAKLRAAIADPGVATIVLDVDSPGGEVAGTPELAAEIAASPKPVVAVANSMAASGAYWIASAADELVVTPSGEVGSIGVLMLYEDDTKAAEAEGVTRTVISAGEFKGELWGPLTDAARAYLEEQVQAVYGTFVGQVAKNRGVPPATVRERYGKGRMLLAPAALEAGMVDRVATLQETLDRFVAGGRVRRRGAIAPGGDDEIELRRRRLERADRR